MLNVLLSILDSATQIAVRYYYTLHFIILFFLKQLIIFIYYMSIVVIFIYFLFTVLWCAGKKKQVCQYVCLK